MYTFFLGKVLTTFYTANLTASLARPFKVKMIQQPSELLQTSNKDVRWLTLKGPLQRLIQVSLLNLHFEFNLHLVIRTPPRSVFYLGRKCYEPTSYQSR